MAFKITDVRAEMFPTRETVVTASSHMGCPQPTLNSKSASLCAVLRLILTGVTNRT